MVDSKQGETHHWTHSPEAARLKPVLHDMTAPVESHRLAPFGQAVTMPSGQGLSR